MKIFKVDAQGDTMFIRAENQAEAESILFAATGPIPTHYLTWHIVPKLPKGEELMAGSR